MSSVKSRKHKESSGPSQKNKLPHFFPSTTVTVETRGRSKMMETQTVLEEITSQLSQSPVLLQETTDCSLAKDDAIQTAHSSRRTLTYASDDNEQEDLRELIKQLPTRKDLKDIVQLIENNHRKEMQTLRSEIQEVDVRLQDTETAVSDMETRMTRIEQEHQQYLHNQAYMQLQIDDQEDRSRRNNLRLRGLPEATTNEDLERSVISIFSIVLGPSSPPTIKIDRVHRAMGPRSSDASRPRDVVCRIHNYKQKEEIIKKAWTHGTVDFDGAQIHILPDLSRATLYRRSLLRPLLERIRSEGLQYKWGYPFHLIVRKNSNAFFLRTPADLTALFTFLEIPPVEVPDWLQRVPDPQRKTRNLATSSGERISPYPDRTRGRRTPAPRHRQGIAEAAEM